MPTSAPSLRGRLLLDGGNLTGSWFQRTVLLICQHDSEGAFGLVLNRPSGAVVGDAVVADIPARLKQLPLLIGGPVQPGALSFLHGDHFLPGATVMPNLDLGHSLDQLAELSVEYSASRKILVFAGYAGWSAGQLDEELKRNSWLVQTATPELIFDSDPKDLWQRILRPMGGKFRLLADSPEDPMVN
ncbi:MAG: YqgE/AlgH family protein [Verrucomicrobiales bacterium]|nr:YqgE/AlgH family protein [Verrucomicrobiales bacterium]